MEINIQLQPKQIELYKLLRDSDYLVLGYGGSKGGAKSHGLRDVLTLLCLEFGGLQTAIFRRISKQLMDNHIVPYFTKYPQIRQFYNVQDRIIKFPNGSLLRFRSADQEDEIYNIQGSEFDICAVDEATHFTKKQLDFLRTCVRGKIGFKAKSVWTTNPGNISHTYIKRIFIDKNFDENERPEDYYYLPAKVYDNAIWVRDALIRDGLSAEEYYSWTDERRRGYCTPENSLYVRNLKGLPKDLQDAYLEGDWDIFGGAFFKTFSKRDEIIKPFKIPEEWMLIGSIDPGWSSPCSFGLSARDFEGNIYRIFTYYEEQKRPQDHAKDILKMIQDCKWTDGRMPYMIVSGKDAFAHKDRYAIIANDVTFADVFREEGLVLTPATTDRKQGWWACKSLMPDKFFVFEGMNEPLVDEISAVISDGKDVEDIQGRGNDPNVSDHCFVKGTKVLTLRGYRKIEKIRVGEYVFTSKGFQKVLLTHKLKNKEVYDYILNGKKITCTPSHKFKTQKGYIPIHNLTIKDILVILDKKEYLCQKQLFLMGLNTDVTPNLKNQIIGIIIGAVVHTTKRVSDICTLIFGKHQTAISPQGIIYTTKTATPITTNYQTLNVKKDLNIYQNTQKNGNQKIKSLLKSTLRRLETLQKFGTVQKKENCGIVNTQNKPQKKENISGLKRLVSFAGRVFNQKQNTENTATLIVKQKHFADVFDLTVENTHEYFVKDFLVHNSLDEFRYSVMALFEPSKKIEEEKEKILKPGEGIERQVQQIDIKTLY